jgi:hypothetical protein
MASYNRSTDTALHLHHSPGNPTDTTKKSAQLSTAQFVFFASPVLTPFHRGRQKSNQATRTEQRLPLRKKWSNEWLDQEEKKEIKKGRTPAVTAESTPGSAGGRRTTEAGRRPGGRHRAGCAIGARAYWQEATRQVAALVPLCIRVGGAVPHACCIVSTHACERTEAHQAAALVQPRVRGGYVLSFIFVLDQVSDFFCIYFFADTSRIRICRVSQLHISMQCRWPMVPYTTSRC